MKRIAIIILVAVLAMSVAGCSCQHEWSEPGCEEAAVCAKCGEIGEPALGHTYSEASCAVPETCSRCGVTRGEALAHSFGEWKMNAPEMYRSCTVCGSEERTEIDYAVYLQQVLPGHWDFAGSVTAYGMITPDDLQWNAIGFYANFSDDGSCSIFNGNALYDATWKFQEHTAENNSSNCYIMLTFADDSQALMCLQEKNGEQKLYFFYDDNQYTWMVKNDVLTSALVGDWAGSDEGKLYVLHLEEDRSLTGSIGGEPVSGIWHLKPVEISNGYRSAELMLNLEIGVYPCNINLGSVEESMTENLEKIIINGWQLPAFRKQDAVNILKLEAAQTVGAGKPIGKWTAESLEITDEKTGEVTTLDAASCSFTFEEDGSFIAQLDRQYTGTWMLDEMQMSQSIVKYYDSIQYRYVFSLGDGESSMYLDEGYMNFFGRNGTLSFRGSFRRENDGVENPESLAVEKLAGTWKVLDMARYQEDGTCAEEQNFEDFFLTAEADGTFTAWFGEETSGQWYFSEYRCDYGREYIYGFIQEGDGGARVYHIQEEGFLKAFYSSAQGDILMTLIKE